MVKRKIKTDKQLLIKHIAGSQRTCHMSAPKRTTLRCRGSVGISFSMEYFTNTLQVLSLTVLHSSSSQLSIFSSNTDTNTNSSKEKDICIVTMYSRKCVYKLVSDL